MKLPLFLKKLYTRPGRLLLDMPAWFFQKPGGDKRNVPEDFDWEFYLDSYPDLRRAGLTSKKDAVNHYVRHGFFEKRIIRPQDKTLIFNHEEIRLRQLKNIAAYTEQQHRIIKNQSYDRTISVSVIITLYNYADYIDACLNTVLNSTFQDFEVIIVNDCSTDDSLTRCRPYFACGRPVTVVDKGVNTGLAHSRNLGIRQARGDYIFILDADNGIYPQCLEDHVQTMHRDRSLIACYAVIDMFDETGAFCGLNSGSPFNFEKLYNGNYIDAMALFNRQELLAIGAYDEHLLERGIGYEDYELWLRIGRSGKRVGFIDRSLSRYLKKQDSMLSIADRYYHTPVMSYLRHTYFIENPPEDRTAILVAGMHRSGTSALAGLIGRLGAYLGPDLIGPKPSNQKGHFEPEKIVRVNNDLLKKLGAAGTGTLPENWLEHEETKKTRARIKNIILKDFRNRNLFLIKDPRLCLLLPLYREVLEELHIRLKVIVMQRDPREVVKSLGERDGLSADAGLKYYQNHIRALEANLSGVQHIRVSFDLLLEMPARVIEDITAFIPKLANKHNHTADQEIAAFIDPCLRHHNSRRSNIFCSAARSFADFRRRLTVSGNGPDFLIIGAQRSGTTSLYHYLRRHPQIQEPAAKELHWFHAGPEESDGYHTGHETQEWYEKQLRPKGKFSDLFMPGRKKLAFEATPEYLYHPLIAKNVARLYPSTKIIVLVRDPLERAISQYYHEKKQGFIDTGLGIEEYFSGDHARARKEEEKLIHDTAYYSHSYEHHCPIARSNYGRQLDRWMRVFPRQQILIIRSEDMFRDPFPVLNPICGFLQIRPYPGDVAPETKKYNRCERAEISEELRKKLSGYFPFDLSVDKFCTPFQAASTRCRR
jgi:GT2 family glycosyltransferase